MERRLVLTTGLATFGLAAIGGTPLLAQTEAAMDEAKLPALLGGNFALMTSQLAQERGTNESVRIFAGLEIAEQQAVAMAFGVEPGTGGLREDHASMMQQLEAVQGQEFDTLYIDTQITGHEELLTIHRAYAANGQDPMARGASMVGVPSIETHLAMLRGIRQSLG